MLTQQFLFLAAHPSCTAAHRIEAFLISFLSEFSNTLALPAGPDLAFIFLYFCLRHSIIRLLKREKLRFVIYIFSSFLSFGELLALAHITNAYTHVIITDTLRSQRPKYTTNLIASPLNRIHSIQVCEHVLKIAISKSLFIFSMA